MPLEVEAIKDKPFSTAWHDDRHFHGLGSICRGYIEDSALSWHLLLLIA